MKLFYTDHITARYMAERFGIKYRAASEDTVEIAGDGFYVGGKILINGYKLYVAEEQHHLFKPMVGDYVEFEDAFLGKIPFKFNRSMFKPGYVSKPNIIMRDGKHFFMPEVEE